MKRSILPAAICGIFLLLTLLFPAPVSQGVRAGLTMFLNAVLPSLLPYFVASSILIQTGVLQMCKRLRPVFLLSCIAGYPTGARLTAELYAQGGLSVPQAKRSIAFASTAGPSFVLGAVATGMLGAPEQGLLLLVPHILSAMLTGGLACLALPCKGKEQPLFVPSDSGAQILVNSIKGALPDLLQVGSFIVFFSAVIHLLEHLGLLDGMAKVFGLPLSLLGIPQELQSGMTAGFLEMTSGCAVCAQGMGTLSQKLVVLCGILSFGGLSVLLQCYAYAARCGIRLRFLLAVKLVQACIAMLLCGLFCLLFPPAAAVFSPVGAEAVFSQPSCHPLILLAAGAGLVLHNLRRKK